MHHVGSGLQAPDDDPGVGGAESGQQFGERQQGLGGHGDGAVVQPGGIGHLPSCVVEFVQGPLDPGQERGAIAVEPDGAALPVEERHAQLGLQPGDRPAHRGLGHP